MGEWAEDLSRPNYTTYFEWHPSVVKAGIECLPAKCNSLDLDANLFSWPLLDDTVSDLITRKLDLFSQISFLRLHILTEGNKDPDALSQWVDFRTVLQV